MGLFVIFFYLEIFIIIRNSYFKMYKPTFHKVLTSLEFIFSE